MLRLLFVEMNLLKEMYVSDIYQHLKLKCTCLQNMIKIKICLRLTEVCEMVAMREFLA